MVDEADAAVHTPLSREVRKREESREMRGHRVGTE